MEPPSILVMQVASPGGPAALQAASRPMPVARDHEVVVQARAIGISSADMMIRRGEYKWMPPLPAIPGNEMAGVVVAVGAQVDGALRGQHVLVSSRELPVRGGCYADAVAVPAEALFLLPPGVSFTDAVSLPNFQLAGALLYESGVRRPRSIAVYGASGGVGLAIAQLATASGIDCIGVVSTHEKAAFVRAAGIPEVLLRDDDLPSTVMELTHGRGVDVVYSLAGPDMIRNLDLLAPLGTLLSYSHLGGFMPDADFYGALRQRLGRSLGVRVYSIHTLDEQHETRRGLLNGALELMACGKLMPPPPTRWPLSRAAEAHEAMESRQTLGKVVLVPDSLW
ncbi:MAG: alcohol dehydrogenase [Ramlibacter sp.]|jgi:NADPH2:quinone reductase|nr:alcohol dehydrogenase [Ramlibacter sp.]MDF2466954.1 alcohol dehydrogenase [Ramlibacter sp.]